MKKREQIIDLLNKCIIGESVANTADVILALFGVSESTSIKQISTELTPQMKEYIAHIKWTDNADNAECTEFAEYCLKYILSKREKSDLKEQIL